MATYAVIVDLHGFDQLDLGSPPKAKEELGQKRGSLLTLATMEDFSCLLN